MATRPILPVFSRPLCDQVRPASVVRHVANVALGPALKRGDGSHNGKPAVIVGVQKQPGANTIDVTARLDLALDTLQQELPAGITIDRKIFRQSDFISIHVVLSQRSRGLVGAKEARRSTA